MNAGTDYLKREIDICRSLTKKPFGVNVMLMSPHVEEVAKLLAEEKVPVITTGAGNPGKYMKLWQSARHPSDSGSGIGRDGQAGDPAGRLRGDCRRR